MYDGWFDRVLELAGLSMHYQTVIELFEGQLEGWYQHMNSDGSHASEEQVADWLKSEWELAADEILEFEA